MARCCQSLRSQLPACSLSAAINVHLGGAKNRAPDGARRRPSTARRGGRGGDEKKRPSRRIRPRSAAIGRARPRSAALGAPPPQLHAHRGRPSPRHYDEHVGPEPRRGERARLRQRPRQRRSAKRHRLRRGCGATYTRAATTGHELRRRRGRLATPADTVMQGRRRPDGIAPLRARDPRTTPDCAPSHSPPAGAESLSHGGSFCKITWPL